VVCNDVGGAAEGTGVVVEVVMVVWVIWADNGPNDGEKVGSIPGT
jgi:hypothetical protein